MHHVLEYVLHPLHGSHFYDASYYLYDIYEFIMRSQFEVESLDVTASIPLMIMLNSQFE